MLLPGISKHLLFNELFYNIEFRFFNNIFQYRYNVLIFQILLPGKEPGFVNRMYLENHQVGYIIPSVIINNFYIVKTPIYCNLFVGRP